MSFYEALPVFSARIAALSPELANAIGNLNDYRAPWFSTDSVGTVLIDPLHFFTALATRSDEVAPALQIEPQPTPLAQLVSSPKAKVRANYIPRPGQTKPVVIARLIKSGQYEIIDGEAFVAWGRVSALTDVNVIVLPCTPGEGLILRVRLNAGPHRSLGGPGLVETLVQALKASPALLARLTSDTKAVDHITQREAATAVFCLGSASSVNRALEDLGYKAKTPKPVNEFGPVRATFRSVTEAAGKRDDRKVLAALIAHKREVDQLLAKRLRIDVGHLESELAKIPEALVAPAA
jgi:hypothetical protein